MVDHIFVVHYSPLVERKEYLTKKFNELNITNYTFYEEYNRNTTSQETMDSYFKLKNLNPAQICITIAHLEIYKKIMSEGYSTCLILEDDARLCDDFKNKLESYMTSLPKDFNLAFINDGCGLHATNIVPDKIWYNKNISRTCCAYIINKKTCELLVKTAIPFTFAIDAEINKQVIDNNLIIYWCEPTIVSDGSVGVYKPSYTQYGH